MPIAERIIKFFSSLKLAVVIILSMAVIAAVGTITEAKFNDSEMANKLVYHSPWMYLVLGVLVIQLIAVMIDRWPWRQHHTGFVLAHIGIIILLTGSWITQRYGIDGSMAFAIGETTDVVQVKDRDILVFVSTDGAGMRPVYSNPADFIRIPPTPERPLVVGLGSEQIKFVDHYQYAFRESEILPTESPTDPQAIRFQLENANVNMTQWLRRERGRAQSELDLGPAKVILAGQALPPSGRNEVVLVPREGSDHLDFVIYNKDKSLRKRGRVRQSETIDTGWMGLKFRLLRYLPRSEERVTYQPTTYFTEMTTSAAKFLLGEKEYWVGLNSPLRIFQPDRVYVVVYGNRQIRLSFPLRLDEFRMGRYQGTMRASSYESDVTVPSRGSVTISMNEPLKYEGFTFYQSSFQENDKGEAVISVLSVNRDPGRWIKYLGSMLIVAGSVILFYFKRVKWIKNGSQA